jgi:UDP-glucose 4-epimerase
VVDIVVDDIVVVLDHFQSGRQSNLEQAQALAIKKNLLLKIIKADISDFNTWENLEACDAVFHIAAQTSVTLSVIDRKKDFSWNVKSSEYLINWIEKNKVKFLLYSNTAGALYGSSKKIPTSENEKIEPLAPYGSTKAFFEMYLRSLVYSWRGMKKISSKTKDGNYFTWASMRLSNVYGVRQISKGEAGVIPIFLEKLLSFQRPTVFGTGRETRDYVNVLDVVDAFMKIFTRMQKEVVDDAFNVGTGREVTTENVYRLVHKNLVSYLKKIKTEEAKSQVAWLSKNSKADSQPLRPGELKRASVSCAKLKKQVNWKALRKIEDNLPELVKYFITKEKV